MQPFGGHIWTLNGCLACESSEINWTADRDSRLVQDVCVDHGRGDIRMAEQFLNRPDIVSFLQQMRGKRVQRVAVDLLVDIRPFRSSADSLLQSVLMDMMPPRPAAARIDRQALG